MTEIFISYRRSASRHLAQLIFRELRQRGHDVFLDVTTIDSGAFDRIILNQIAARPHFLLILSPGSLERCANEGDWLRREIEEAFRLQRNIIPIFDEGFSIDHEKQYLPAHIQAELPRLNAPPYSHYYFDAFIETVSTRFLKAPVYEVKVVETPAVERVEVQRRIEQAAGTAPTPPKTTPAPTRSKVYDILPAPFDWIEIPAGKVTLEKGGYVPEGGKTFEVATFQIAKYPITNAQYEVFVKQGYPNPKWWDFSGEAAAWRKQNAKPQTTGFAGGEMPRTNVTWYEAVAFCLWLSDVSGEKIMLPTEQQWQRAAQGDDERVYPWGNEWDGSRCNNSVKPVDSNSTSLVTRYEDKGNSPFGVVDLSGNVWEWCITDYNIINNDINIKTEYRVLRGGSWVNIYFDSFCAVSRNFDTPNNSENNCGFRVARSS